MSQAILLICKIILFVLLLICLVSCVICVSCFVSAYLIHLYISQVFSQVTPQPVEKSPVVNRPLGIAVFTHRACYFLTPNLTSLFTGETINGTAHK
jgi:hypothetical protein